MQSFSDYNDSKKLFLKEPFHDRYTLTVKTEVLAGSIPIKTTTEIRWDLSVSQVLTEGSIIELLTLNHQLTETNNPNFKELASMSQAFGRMYNELVLLVDKAGRVQKILNSDMLQRKWSATKKELQSIDESSDAVKGIILLNDDIFTTPEKMIVAVQQNEFFGIFFNGIYGTRLPAQTPVQTKWNHFQQAEVQWVYFLRPFDPLAGSPSIVAIEITGEVVNKLNKTWIKKAYSSFPNIDLEQVAPRLVETGLYTIKPGTGKLVKAHLLKEEIAHPQLLYSRIEYILLSDETLTGAANTKPTSEIVSLN